MDITRSTTLSNIDAIYSALNAETTARSTIDTVMQTNISSLDSRVSAIESASGSAIQVESESPSITAPTGGIKFIITGTTSVTEP